MEGRKRIAVVGSDARQAAAGRALARAGYAVAGAEQVARADVILLPLPLDESRTPLAQLLRAAKPGAFALGGRLSAQAVEIARQAGVELAAVPCGVRRCWCWGSGRWGRRWPCGCRRWGPG